MEVCLVIVEHIGFLQAVRQLPTEYDLLRLQRCVALRSSPMQERVPQHPGAERQQQDFGTALFSREGIMLSRMHRNQALQQYPLPASLPRHG